MIEELTRTALQAETNKARLLEWQWRYFFVIGKYPDIAGHIVQKRRGFEFPLPGRWPAVDALANFTPWNRRSDERNEE
jgi:hypothetical protein